MNFNEKSKLTPLNFKRRCAFKSYRANLASLGYFDSVKDIFEFETSSSNDDLGAVETKQPSKENY